MNNKDYEQKKRECWEKFSQDNPAYDLPYCHRIYDIAFDRAYALGKQEKGADGEEMLMVPRNKVQEMFTEAQKAFPTCEHDRGFRNAELTILRNLFGSKCLPDDVDSSEPKVNVGDEDVWDKRIIAYVDEILNDGDCIIYSRAGNRYIVHESDLEPYTEPNTSHETPVCENHSDNTSQKEVNVSSNRSFLKKVEDRRRVVVVNRALVLKPGTKVRVKDPKNIWHLCGGTISDVWPNYDHPEKTIVAIDFPEGSMTRCTDAFTAEDLRPF